MKLMKTIIKYTLIAACSILLTSCSLTFSGLVALDNSINSGSKKIEFKKLTKLKEGTKVAVELTDSTVISGTLISFEENKSYNGKEFQIGVLDSNKQLKLVSPGEVNNCTYIEEGGSIWTALIIGAVIDAVIIYFGSKSHSGLGNARLF